VRHFHDPSDPQFELIQQLYARFVAANPARAVSITECGLYAVEDESLEAAVRRGSEQALHAQLAARYGIEAISGEPPPVHEVQRLVEYYGTEPVSYFYYIRPARQFLAAQAAGTDVEDYDAFVRALPGMQDYLAFDQLDFSLDTLTATHHRLFPGTQLDPNAPLADGTQRPPNYYRDLVAPPLASLPHSPLHKIALSCNIMRLQNLSRLIQDLWQRGASIFDTHGNFHAWVMEDILPEMLGTTVQRYIGVAACKNFTREI